MTTPSQNKILSKRAFIMIIIGIVTLILLAGATTAAFFASIQPEWKTSRDLHSLSKRLDIIDSKDELTKIADSDRVLEILAADSSGAIIYTINNIALFSDPNAVVLYDSDTGLIKFSGERTSYFERNSILGALINVGDDDDLYDDDDERPLPFDYHFVKDNTYQTIVISNKGTGNNVYIVCSQDYHTGFVIFLVSAIVAWSLLVLYILITISISISDNAKKHGSNYRLWGAAGFVPAIGLIAYLIFRLVLFIKNNAHWEA